mmetsp:Transcript_22434/g.51693  ORF Transcript_22434/g.51693 Transcript_22434/m.51693 type:complete len:220 (+) Transcript_22434:53-712(+)
MALLDARYRHHHSYVCHLESPAGARCSSCQCSTADVTLRRHPQIGDALALDRWQCGRACAPFRQRRHRTVCLRGTFGCCVPARTLVRSRGGRAALLPDGARCSLPSVHHLVRRAVEVLEPTGVGLRRRPPPDRTAGRHGSCRRARRHMGRGTPLRRTATRGRAGLLSEGAAAAARRPEHAVGARPRRGAHRRARAARDDARARRLLFAARLVAGEARVR